MPESNEHDDDLLERLGASLRDETTGRDDEMEALLTPPRGKARDFLLDGFEQRLQAAPSETAEASKAQGESVAEVVSLAPRRVGWLTAVAAVAVALAAALLFWFLVPGAGEVGLATEYTVASLQAGRSQDRAQPTDITAKIVTAPDDIFRVVLSPTLAVSTAVSLAVVVRPLGGDGICARPSDGVEISEVGAVKIDGTLDQFATVTQGQWQLELWVGRAESLPLDGATGVEAAPSDVHVTRLALEVLSTP